MGATRKKARASKNENVASSPGNLYEHPRIREASGSSAAKSSGPTDGLRGQGTGTAGVAKRHLRRVVEEITTAESPVDKSSAKEPSRAEVKPLAVVVDGKQVLIEAADEIVLRCGEATITLRRNGRVIIRGAYVETRSRGVNRIKGGSVQIN